LRGFGIVISKRQVMRLLIGRQGGLAAARAVLAGAVCITVDGRSSAINSSFLLL
jgi:hypothetical protein